MHTETITANLLRKGEIMGILVQKQDRIYDVVKEQFLGEMIAAGSILKYRDASRWIRVGAGMGVAC